MSRPVIQLDPEKTDYAALAKRLAILAGLEITDEDGMLLVQRLPEEISARLAVLKAAEAALNEIPLADGEIAIATPNRLHTGNGSRFGGTDILRANRIQRGLLGHVPGTVTFVCRRTAGNVEITCATSSGQFSVLWWDGTITSHDSAATATKAHDSPSAAWTNAPKTVRVFPATVGENLTTFVMNVDSGVTAIDTRGAPLTQLIIPRSLIDEYVAEAGLTTISLNQSATLRMVDISGLSISSGGVAIEGPVSPGQLEVVRAVGTTVGSGHVLTLQFQSLSAAALNRLFSDLAAGEGEIFVGENPGSDTCDPTIATAKGYTVATQFV